MDLINGLYLKHEICVFSGNDKSMWLVVYDGKCNYCLFNTLPNAVTARYNHNRMPCNGMGMSKQVEYYSTFDNALGNLVKVVANNGFLTRSRGI